MDIDYRVIMDALLLVAGSVAAVAIGVASQALKAYVEARIDSRVTSEARNMAFTLVSAAEQMYESSPEKFDYVLSSLEKTFPALDSNLLEGFVESAVFDLKRFYPEKE